MSNLIMNALLAEANAKETKAIANLQNYLSNPAGIGEHSDIIEAIEIELEAIAKYNDQIEMINKYFLREY